jgi:hypothetical protein
VASDRYRYCCKSLDKLFSRQEQARGAVEPTGAGNFLTLDVERLAILKGKNFMNNKLKNFLFIYY